MMGTRGHAGVDDGVAAYTQSTAVDQRMLLHDIWGSQAHVLMLGSRGILSDDDVRQIAGGLERARSDAEAGRFTLDPSLEDVHMNVEAALRRDVGSVIAGRLHTARSRNDQVITDARLFVREELLKVELGAVELARVFLDLADQHETTVVPGYTHTQHAQPITLAFWATAHTSLLAEDLRRLSAAYATTDRNPLGACALAGTSFPIDRDLTTRLLGFADVQVHALAAVSGRDFILEAAFALSMLMSSLSRIAEEIIYWTSYEYGYFVLDDAYALGSSIMPQKKNPTVAELARGRTGAVHGRLVQLLTMMKALPLGYHSDLQEDKPPLWDAFDTVGSTLTVMARMLGTTEVRADRMLDATYGSFSTATDLANYLVADGGLAFRDAHELVGRVVGALVDEGLTFQAIDRCAELLRERGHALPTSALRDVLDPESAVRRATSMGGTSPDSVRRMATDLRGAVDACAEDADTRRTYVDNAKQAIAGVVQRVLDGSNVSDAVGSTA